MALTLTWHNRNRLVQADQVIAYDDGSTGSEEGQQTVVEWRFRADPSDPWGAPTVQTITAPPTASYEPPGAGWVQITCYSTRDGLNSWQSHVGVVAVDGGGDIEFPEPRITETGDPRVTESGDVRITE